MRIPLSVIFLVVLGSGCTTSKILPPQATRVAYREANDKLAGRNADVRTSDGRLFNVYSPEITADSVLGWSRLGSAGSEFAIGEVFEIRTEDRMRGGFVGGAIGAGIGLILILADAIADRAPTQGEWPVAGLAIGIAGWGATIGAIRGGRTQYRFAR